ARPAPAKSCASAGHGHSCSGLGVWALEYPAGHRIEARQHLRIATLWRGDKGMIERPLTTLTTRRGMPRQQRNHAFYQRPGLLRIGKEVPDDHIDSDRIVPGMPAIVIGDHRDGRVADLGFPGELRLGHVGHPDHVALPRTVELAFGKA